jgi:hypothetical protein
MAKKSKTILQKNTFELVVFVFLIGLAFYIGNAEELVAFMSTFLGRLILVVTIIILTCRNAKLGLMTAVVFVGTMLYVENRGIEGFEDGIADSPELAKLLQETAKQLGGDAVTSTDGSSEKNKDIEEDDHTEGDADDTEGDADDVNDDTEITGSDQLSNDPTRTNNDSNALGQSIDASKTGNAADIDADADTDELSDTNEEEQTDGMIDGINSSLFLKKSNKNLEGFSGW